MKHRAVLVALMGLLLLQAGCRSEHGEWTPSPRSYALNLSGYEVPKPDNVPYSGAEDRGEYLRFYHSGYLAAVNEREAFVAINITPDSPRPQAAVDGWNDGFSEGTRVKHAYWRERGVEPFGVAATRPMPSP